jgi:hypothetical protein
MSVILLSLETCHLIILGDLHAYNFLSFAVKQIFDLSDNNSDYDGEDANCMCQNHILKPRPFSMLCALCCMLLLCFAVLVQYNTTHVCDTASTQKPFVTFILVTLVYFLAIPEFPPPPMKFIQTSKNTKRSRSRSRSSLREKEDNKPRSKRPNERKLFEFKKN